MPFRLANPAAFLDLEVRPGECLWMSKEMPPFFDTLAAPKGIQRFSASAVQ